MQNTAPVKWEHADYLSKLIRTEDLRSQVKIAAEELREHDFDTIAFAGISGALISIPTALAMNKTMLVVRKPQDVNASYTEFGSHSGRVVEGNVGSSRYVIMDDLVSSGRTYKRIIEQIAMVAPKADCIGIYTVYGMTFKPLSSYV